MHGKTLLAALAGFGTAAQAIDQISVKGSKFFTSSGSQFFVKGIAYQLVPDDPLIDNEQCSNDASLMQELGTNSIRVYHVDPDGDHDDCMKTFADAGIYLWLDLDTFNTQIEQTSPHWNESQRDAFAKVMDAFEGYDNLAGFFVGNEVLTTGNGSVAAPYVKAASRDLKSYRDSKGYRDIPIGYSAADIASLRPMLQNYLACDNASEALDFFALNAYSWCGDSTYEQSGYVDLIKNVTDVDYNIPIFFSETGCNTVRPRTFEDQLAIFGDEMTPHWSGSIVYEWIQEANNYGLISYGPKVDPSSPDAPPDGFPRSGKPTPVDPDFDNLSKVWASATPSGVKKDEYTPGSLSPPPCPEFTSQAWEVNPSSALPTLGQAHDPEATQSGGGGGGGGGGGSSGGDDGAEQTGTDQPSATPSNAANNAHELRNMGLGLAAVLAYFVQL